MTRNFSGNQPAGQGGPGNPVRSGVWLGVLAVALALAAVAWYRHRQAATVNEMPPGSGSNVLSENPTPPAQPAASPERVAEPSAPAPAQIAAPQPVAIRPQIPTPAPPPSPVVEPSAYTRGLVANLSSLDPSRGPITPERVQSWKQEYDKLLKEGASAVPAIREMLEKQTDVNFKTREGGDLVGAPSLRVALFDALRQIGGSDAAAVAAQAMQTTTNPREVAMLAADLEAMAPGQYGDAAMAAARAGLARAAQTPGQADFSSLFEVLQKFGGSGVAGELEQAALKWNYYGPLALASLPDGAGVAALARMAQNADGSFGNSSKFALRLLAQLAPQYPDAAQALLSQVSQAKVPETAWMGIGLALSGEQTYYGDATLNGTAFPTNNTVDHKTYRIAANEQNYESVNLSASWTPEQLQKQLSLVDQMIAANPSAARALEPTRSALSARLHP